MRILGLIFCFLLLLLLTRCAGESATVRYKIIAKAEIAGKIYESYAVNEMTVTALSQSLSSAGASASMSAEATILDLGDRGALYILQTVNDHPPALTSAYRITPTMGDLDSDGIRKLRDFNSMGRRPYLTDTMPRYKPFYYTKMPKMVAFENEKDRTTIFEVTAENFSDHFGHDAIFLGLFIEPTDEPLSNNIKKRLPWWIRDGGVLVRRDPDAPLGRLDDAPVGRRTSHFEFKQ